MDPFYSSVPSLPEYLLNQVTIYVIGLFDCETSNHKPTMFIISLQGEVIVNVKMPAIQMCQCPNCMEEFVYSTPEMTTGWPGYNYGDLNNLTVEIFENFICLSEIQISLNFYKGKKKRNPQIIFHVKRR